MCQLHIRNRQDVDQLIDEQLMFGDRRHNFHGEGKRLRRSPLISYFGSKREDLLNLDFLEVNQCRERGARRVPRWIEHRLRPVDYECSSSSSVPSNSSVP